MEKCIYLPDSNIGYRLGFRYDEVPIWKNYIKNNPTLYPCVFRIKSYKYSNWI